MTALCKWMVADASIAVETATTVVDLGDVVASAYVLTAPVPQSLAVLSFSRLLPEPTLADALAAIRYRPTIAVLAVLDGTPTGLPAEGAVQLLDHDDLAFVCDNRAKGVSSTPALTVHFGNDRSAELWAASDEVVVERAAVATAPWRGPARFTATQVHRWRYAGPAEVWPEPTVVWGENPVVALAGEAFAGPKVEGAFTSGEAAAEAVHRRLG
jgi:renalase